MANVNATLSAPTGLIGRLQAYVATLKEAARRRDVFRRTVRELNALSDREMSDLGIARIQVEDVAREAAYAK